jgi:hypothetical protein
MRTGPAYSPRLRGVDDGGVGPRGKLPRANRRACVMPSPSSHKPPLAQAVPAPAPPANTAPVVIGRGAGDRILGQPPVFRWTAGAALDRGSGPG